MKEEKKVILLPIPKSGGFSSILLGLIAVLLTLIVLQENTIALHLNYKDPNNPSKSNTEIQWQNSPISDDQLKPRYVESNPNVPENPPDEVKQFSFRDQQAAQPEIREKTTEQIVPKIDSSDNNPKIIDTSKKLDSPPPTSLPLPSNSKQEVKSPSPPKTLIFSKADVPKPKKTDGSYSKKALRDGKDKEKTIIASLQIPSPSTSFTKIKPQEFSPQARPRLSPDLIHGPLMKSLTSAPRMGKIAIECRLHPYGVYIQEMLQSIEEQWNQLAMGSIRYLQRDRLPGQITLRFKLEATGNISNLSRIDDEGYSLAAELCRQAIASRVPFGEWTQKMIQDFGQSDEITLNFQYR